MTNTADLPEIETAAARGGFGWPLPALVVLATGTLLAFGAFLAVSRWEARSEQADFERYAGAIENAVADALDAHVDELRDIRKLFRASPDVDAEQFRGFVSDALERRKGLVALGYAPRVGRGERLGFEAHMRTRSGAAFEVRARDAQGRTAPAPEAEEYWPLSLVEPADARARLLGFDLAAQVERGRALAHGERDIGALPADGLPQLGREAGYLVELPLQHRAAAAPAREGLVVAVLDLRALLDDAFARLEDHDVEIAVVDGGREPAAHVAYASAAPGRGAVQVLAGATSGLRHTSRYDLGGRELTFVLEPAPSYHSFVEHWPSWFALGALLAATWFMASLLRRTLQAAQRVRWMVDERTSELRATNARLAHEIELRRAAEDELRHRANHDPLTGLPNRALFEDRLERAIARARRWSAPFALLYADLDRFKAVNDEFGHAAGDELLRAFAERVRGVLREEDTLARIGGDEFALLLPQVATHADAEVVARKILAALAEPFELRGRALVSGTSLGIAMFPGDAQGAEELLHRADEAMYAAKARERGSFGFAAQTEPTR